LDADSDDDGIPDGEDVEFIQLVIDALPNKVLLSTPGEGGRTALLEGLDAIELLIAQDNQRAALLEIKSLLRRLNGCGDAPDRNDLVRECASQIQVRDLFKLLQNNLSVL
jgi:hypothetical protein